jgi:hypothetical protein
LKIVYHKKKKKKKKKVMKIIEADDTVMLYNFITEVPGSNLVKVTGYPE